MAQLAPLIKAAKQACRDELKAAGFRPHKNVYIRDLAEGYLGSVGLMKAAYTAEQKYLITPIVGVFGTEVERQVACWWEVRREMLDRKYKYHMPTVSTALGYIMPENTFKSWYFSPDEETLPLARNLVKCVIDYGVPWMNNLADLRALLELISKEGASTPGLSEYAIPAIYWVLGEEEKAREYARQVIELTDKRGPDYRWSMYTVGWPEYYKVVMSTI